MPRTVVNLVLGLIILGLAITIALRVAPGGDDPLLTGSSEHDFGSAIVYGVDRTFEHQFTLVNAHDAPISIRNAVPSCGCTSASWPREPVDPGASIDVTVTVVLARITTTGVNIKLLLEGEGLPEDALHVLNVSLDCVRDEGFEAEPASIELPAPGGDPVSIELVVRAEPGLEPPTRPSAFGPDGVTVTFEDWRSDGPPSEAKPERRTGQASLPDVEPDHVTWRARGTVVWDGTAADGGLEPVMFELGDGSRTELVVTAPRG